MGACGENKPVIRVGRDGEVRGNRLRTRYLRGLRLFAALLFLGTLMVLAAAGNAFAAPAKMSTGWFYPLGSPVSAHSGAGFLARNYTTNDKGELCYHLGVDYPAKKDTVVYAVADGKVIGKMHWHEQVSAWGHAYFVQHEDASGAQFVVLYGHLGDSLQVDDKVFAGKPIGAIAYDHLHLGLLPGTRYPANNQGMMPEKNWLSPNRTNGYEDPQAWFDNHRAPGYQAPPTTPGTPTSVAKYAGQIVQWDGDTKQQKTSWYVTSDLRRLWIPDIATYQLLKAMGATASKPLPAKVLDQLPDQKNCSAAAGDTMTANRTMRRGMFLKSADKRHMFILQSDGNLVLYGPSGVLWASRRSDIDCVIFQGDGNLVGYRNDGKAVWASNTAGRAAKKLTVQNDGNVVIYASSTPLWATNTAPKPATPPPTTPPPTTPPADTNLRKILRDTASGACYLITAAGKRSWIPTGGDYQAIVNNGVQVVQTNWTTISRYQDAGYQAIVRRMDDPVLGGDSKWFIYKGSGGWDGDYVITQSASGKPYYVNTATWTLSNGRGQVRVNCYVPQYDAAATVVYNVYDGDRLLGSVPITQANVRGKYVQLGTWQFSSGTVTVRVFDNQGSSYGQYMAFDMCEAIPVG